MKGLSYDNLKNYVKIVNNDEKLKQNNGISDTGYDINPLSDTELQHIYETLPSETLHIVRDKGTERPFNGKNYYV